MSSLLEEAILDAKALKDAALKNAENAVLEKYSGDVKKALDTLLEQEMGEESGGEELMEFAEDVPYAFQNEELDQPGPEEIIEIDFDALKQRLEEEDEVVTGSDMIAATAMADEIALEEDEDPTFTQMAQDEDAAEATTAVTAGGEDEAYLDLKEADADEDINLSEDMLSELIEELVVDMTPRPQGWSSINSADNSIEQANNDAMAAAQAAHLEEEEEAAEQISTASDVVSDAELFEAKVSELTESNRELRALLLEAKHQLQKMN